MWHPQITQIPQMQETEAEVRPAATLRTSGNLINPNFALTLHNRIHVLRISLGSRLMKRHSGWVVSIFLIATALLATGSQAVWPIKSAASLQAGKPAAVFDVRTYGAKGDGRTLDTVAINKA